MARIRVLVIAENRLSGEGAAATLNSHLDLKATATTNIETALSRGAHVAEPEIILLGMDLNRPGGVDNVRRILRRYPRTKIIAVSTAQSPTHLLELLRAGVSGLIPDNAKVGEYAETIRAVYEGNRVVPSALAALLVSQIVQHPNAYEQPIPISEREKQIADAIARGRSNQQIATDLELSIHTVKSHVHNILRKLGLHSRLQLAALALGRSLPIAPADLPPPTRRRLHRKV